ncbi:leucine-rich repeat domain-containing protein [bacterium]|nr:leucine-rich repeat domain-containing protein [bacterium]
MIKHFFFYLLIIMFICQTSSCKRDKSPIFPFEIFPVADAGPDQTICLGSYGVMDPSGSTTGEGGEIGWYEWEQNEDNPAEILIHSSADCWIYATAFVKEGVYRFSLKVMDVVNNSESIPDELVITVKSRNQIVFEDPLLEIHVRYALNKQTGNLTDADLLSLDTLSVYEVSYFPSLQIESLKGIEKCSNLKCLFLAFQLISDLSPLSNLTKLIRLDIDQNHKLGETSPLTDISPLAGFTQLQHLNLQLDNVSDITPLKNLTQLQYLNFMDNPIQDISALVNAKNLQQLWMSRSPISDISVLSEMDQMYVLWLTHCEIEDIGPLTNMTGLRLLNLNLNQITDTSPLAGMVNLDRLSINFNLIVDISALINLQSINILDLSHNQIVDILPLVNNPGLNRGDLVSLYGNPLSEQSINEYLPLLRGRGVYVSFR